MFSKICFNSIFGLLLTLLWSDCAPCASVVCWVLVSPCGVRGLVVSACNHLVTCYCCCDNAPVCLIM